MGILNVTPDSFSDGGKFYSPEKAIRHGLQLIEEGADIVDIGGESTRPGSDPVMPDEELKRVIPVIEGLRRLSSVPISIDTYKSEVAASALMAGADIINDITAGRGDEGMFRVASEKHAPIILMHMQGLPKSMQENPTYKDVVTEVLEFFRSRVMAAEKSGIEQIIIDPGIGFGKTFEHNIELLRNLRVFTTIGRPLLVGTSRKAFIGKILNATAEQRYEGTIASVVISILRGANVVRVHDVAGAKKAALVADALKTD